MTSSSSCFIFVFVCFTDDPDLDLVWPGLDLFCSSVFSFSVPVLSASLDKIQNYNNIITNNINKMSFNNQQHVITCVNKLTGCPDRQLSLSLSTFPSSLHPLICSLVMSLFVLFIPPSVFPSMSLCPYLQSRCCEATCSVFPSVTSVGSHSITDTGCKNKC